MASISSVVLLLKAQEIMFNCSFVRGATICCAIWLLAILLPTKIFMLTFKELEAAENFVQKI